jgi:UDP-N-acetylglucosamine 4,6-dehydratase
MRNILKNKAILVTGGTGSFGKNFLFRIQKYFSNVKKIVIFSRDELKQYELSKSLDQNFLKKVRFFLGDIRDYQRLLRAMQDIDIIIHAAALKQVPAAEYDPFEFVKTNIIGAQNIIEACLNSKVKNVVALSTDKAASPTNLYGATKLCSDKLFSSANNIVGKNKIKFSVVRYGNVMGSRGSVIPYFLQFQKKGYFPVTDTKMTRFNITLKEAVDMVLWTLQYSKGGEIFVPKIPSYRILDLAKAINSKNKIKLIGIRPGEKLDEEMISVSDSFNTVDLGKYYAILNPLNSKKFKNYINYKKFPAGKSYNSKENIKFLNVKELKKLIMEYGKI